VKAVYTISDLVNRATLDQGVDKPAQAALDDNNMNMRYIRIEVAPGEVKEAFKRMAQLGFVGCNVTVPHKLEAMECCDTLSEDAEAIGVVNTISFSNNKVMGHNTDGPGLERAIREDFKVELAKLRVAIGSTRLLSTLPNQSHNRKS